MELLDAIYTRRSIRHYTDEPVSKEHTSEIIKAGTWAPSGLNNQPWRFCIVRDKDTRANMAGMTKYGRIIEDAPLCIVVFIDKEVMYNTTKDHQAIGACLQNMLLAAHGLGLGAVWLGEILKSTDEVRMLLDIEETFELMAVIAIGHPSGNGKKTSTRRSIKELILKEV